MPRVNEIARGRHWRRLLWGLTVAAVALIGGQGLLGTIGVAAQGTEGCPFNRAAKAFLCPYAVAGSGELAIGSDDGQWAFVLSDGRPKLVQYGGAGVETKWAAKRIVRRPPGCPKFTVSFRADGNIDMLCKGRRYARFVIAPDNRSGRTLKWIAIDNFGTVLFRAGDGTVLLTIDPVQGPIPASAFRVLGGSFALAPVRTTPRKIIPTSPRKPVSTKPRNLPKTTIRKVHTTPAELPAPPPQTTTLAPVPLPPLPPSPSGAELYEPQMDRRNMLLKSSCTYLPVPYDSDKDAKEIFNIDLVVCGGPFPRAAPVFIRAAQTWMSVLVGDIADYIPAEGEERECLMDFNRRPMMRCGFVDDIVIGFTLHPVDGVGKVIGSGAPMFSRGSDWPRHRALPVSGWMYFDQADVEMAIRTGQAFSIVLHEMGHVLGFGTTWSELGLVYPPNCEELAAEGDVEGARFIGQAANDSLEQIRYTKTNYTPVEGLYGPGSACMHWSERLLGNELMTSVISTRANHLTLVTIAAFEDMGYTVDRDNYVFKHVDYALPNTHTAPSHVKSVKFELTGCLHGWKPEPAIPYSATAEGRRRK